MIKKIILTLWILIITTTTANALNLWTNLNVRQNWDYWYSPYNNDYNINVVNKWNLLTDHFWLTLKWIYLREWTYMVRKRSQELNWILPYLAISMTWFQIQWYPKKYAICDEFDGENHIEDYNLTWCNIYELNQNSIGIITRIMESITNNDTFWFKYEYELLSDTSRNFWWVIFCFSSNNYQKSICFWISEYKWFITEIYPWYRLNNDDKYWYTWYWVELPYSFTNLYNENLDMSPWWTNTPEQETGTNVIINTQCPTIWQLMTNMWNNYNTWLCYNNTTYFNWTNLETIEKQNIFTIFNNDYENYNNRISIYRNNCNAPATATACQTAFSGEYKKYSIIANAINSKIDEKKLRNYCNMWLNYDINATTCTAGTWIIKEDYTPEERLESIIGTINTIPTPNINVTISWWNNVFNSLCDPNNPENCFTNDNIRDIFWSLQNIYAKITWLFRERNGVKGIIPEYILRIAFVTILFTIIFKK